MLTLYPAHSYGTAREYAEFTFTAPGAGTSVAASAIDGCDLVASIAHVGGTNKLTVTLKKPFNKVVYVDAVVLGTAGAWASCGGVTNEGTSSAITFDIYTWVAAGTASNDNAATIMVSLAVRNGNWGTK